MGALFPTLIFGALALFFYIRGESNSQAFEGDKSIAVLPFENRSNLEEDEFFIKGFHDGLLTQISRIPGIRTVGRTSVMVYQDTTKNLKTIGQELGVSALLEGGVQRAGDEVRITVQLRAAAADAHMWSENYTRKLTAENIFEIQDEITKAIANALKLILSPEEKQRIEKLPTESLAALEAYFKGMQSLSKGSRGGSREARIHFEEAISEDPDFALAHAMLGKSLFPSRAGPERFGEEAVKEAGTHILRALELDDSLSEAYSVQGLQREAKRDYDSAEESYKKAIELDPNNAEAYQSYAAFLRRRDGRTRKAATLHRKAYVLDPKHEFAQDRLSLSFSALGQWEEALKARLQWVAENPESYDAHRTLGRIYDKTMGRWDDAVVAYRKALALGPRSGPLFTRLRDVYAGLGDTGQAIGWIDRYLEYPGPGSNQAYFKCYKFNLTGDDSSRERSALEGLKEYPGNGELLEHLTDLYIASGQADEVRTRWELAYPAFFDPSPDVYATNASYAKDVARVLMATGDQKQANRLIKEALAVVSPQAPYLEILSLEASLHAVAGDDSKALDAIRRFLDAGGSPYELMLQDELKRFESHPEYQPMAEKRKAELAIQLEHIRAMEANGELAAIPELPAN